MELNFVDTKSGVAQQKGEKKLWTSTPEKSMAWKGKRTAGGVTRLWRRDGQRFCYYDGP